MPRSPLLLLLVIAAAACSRGDDAAGGEAAQPVTTTLELLTFSRLQGFAEGAPCDPEEIPPLPAALELAGRLRAEGKRVLLACVGDAVFWTPSITKHKASQVGARGRSEPLLAAMAAADVEVYVPGHGDFAIGYESHLERVRAAGLTALLSNLAVEGFDDVIRDRMLVEHEGLRLGLLGLVPPPREGKDEVMVDAHLGRFTPPLVAAAEKVRQLREEDGADLVIIYSNLSQQTNGELGKIDGVRFVVGTSDPGAPSGRLTLVHGTGLVTMRTQGRELARTTLHVQDGSLGFHNLSGREEVRREIEKNRQALADYAEQYGTDDPDVLARRIAPHDPSTFHDFLDRLETDAAWLAEADAFAGTYVDHRRAELTPVAAANPLLAFLARQGPSTEEALERMTRVPLEEIEPLQSIPTPDTCRACHAPQVDFWAATDHATAIDALRPGQRTKDGSCLICHVTGYREVGGFNDVRLEDPLGSVTCWNCHQVTQLHVVSPRHHTDPRHFDSDPASVHARCESCHTGRRDPGFRLDDALPRVSCPPMRADAPALVQARHATLQYIEDARAQGTTNEFDIYLEARALLGLGRTAEAIQRFVDYAATAQTSEVLPFLDAASLLDRAGHSAGALRVLETALLGRAGDPLLNMQVVRLLLEANDPATRNPERAVVLMEQFLPPEAGVDYRTLDMRKVQVQAYFAAGETARGAALLEELLLKYPNDRDLHAMAEVHGLRR